jgi:hypothetical protein
MDPVTRFDLGQLRKPEKLDNGFMRVDAVLTRTGVFKYLNADGSTRRELRLPEEVFNADAMKSFGLMPVTDEHPPVPLTADNAKQYSRGTVGEAVRQDGKFVTGSLMVQDSALVKALESGAKREVSCGYSCDLEWKSGEYEGERYDAIQRNIRGNHVAVVKWGRAGPEVRVRLDANDAIMLPVKDEEVPVVKIKVDGVEYEASESLAQAIGKQQAQHADALKTVQASADQATARADTAETKLKDAEKARKDAEDPAKLRTAIRARVDLETKARPVLGEDYKMDEADDLTVMKAVVAKVSPDLKLDGKSDGYIVARFDLDIERHAAASKKAGDLHRTVTDGGLHRDDAAPGYGKARTKFIEESRKAGTDPIPGYSRK